MIQSNMLYRYAAMAAVLTLAVNAAEAGSAATVGVRVPPAQRIPVGQIEHDTWDRLLKEYVDSDGMVDYSAWKASAADRRALLDYLRHLSAASFPSGADRDAKLAFWINAYNALTIEGILREYPTTSIRNHTAKLFGYNIWEDFKLLVGGEPYSLEQIEHEILREMGEPRIHFAIVCASIGCPPLRQEAYTADKLDQQLADNARAFFADRGKFRFDASRNAIAVSPILDWFAEDFGDSQAERLRTIAPYLPGEQSRRLAKSGQARVNYLDYDWGINDQDRAK